MNKKFSTLAFVYAIVAMACGVFAREYTKIIGFTGVTRLKVMHTHYFMLGMFFFLLLLCLNKAFKLEEQKNINTFLLIYNIGLNITGVTFLIRGLSQTSGKALSSGQEGALAGISGIGHILTGIGIIAFLVFLRKQVKASEK